MRSLSLLLQTTFCLALLMSACKPAPKQSPVTTAPTNGGVVSSQLYDMRTDTFNVFSPNGVGAEFRLENSTRHVTGGVLTNTDKTGLTRFEKLHLVENGTTGIGIVGQDSISLNHLKWYLPMSGGVLSGGMSIISTAASPKLWLGWYSSGTGHKNAPTTFDKASVYMGIGGREYGANSYRSIGFGYVSAVTDNYPALVGFQEIAPDGNTSGDLVFGTRAGTANTAPAIRFRITAAGAVKSYAAPLADEDVSTKKYTDQVTVTDKTAAFTVAAANSRAVFTDKGATSPVTFSLPAAATGLAYTFIQRATAALTVAAPKGAVIADGGVASGDGGAAVSSSAGSVLALVAVDGATWQVIYKSGTWTVK